MITIIGLGNPGKEYINNRHNVGIEAIGTLAKTLNKELREERYLPAMIAKTDDAVLVTPLTFINNSGQAISKLVREKELVGDDIWVIHDDTEIPFGQIRIKQGGSSAGHNGIKSIDEAIGTDYWRIRVGVGRPENVNIDLADYVLSDFTSEEEKLLPNIIDSVVDLLIQSLKAKQLQNTTINAKKD